MVFHAIYIWYQLIYTELSLYTYYSSCKVTPLQSYHEKLWSANGVSVIKVQNGIIVGHPSNFIHIIHKDWDLFAQPVNFWLLHNVEVLIIIGKSNESQQENPFSDTMKHQKG